MTSPVVTRFAPSPTGFLHIGGARTALFNWLFAKHHGGEFLLRIEDTDRKRSTQEAIDAILAGMSWLGLQHDGEVVYQSQRATRHAEIAHQLLSEGKAYYCYASQEELAEMREKARAEGRYAGYDGRWRDRPPSEAPAGVDPVIRFKAPQTGETTLEDAVQGSVTQSNSELDDMVLLRADGSPTYMLSVVVDDHDMGITHAIRGDDHLNNAFRQTQIYHALGWKVPVWAHIPLIHGPDGAKLSKRHGALGVEAYQEMGYLPEAMRNYLLRLGWAHGDEELLNTDQAIALFDLDGVGRSPARFDFDKLNHINSHYLKSLAPEDLLEAAAEFFSTLEESQKTRLLKGLPALTQRAETLKDLAAAATYLTSTRPLEVDEKAAKLLDSDAREVLGRLLQPLQQLSSWDEATLDQALRAFVDAEALKFGKVGQPLRAALCGTTSAPGVTDVLIALGREESLARIGDQAI